ncbi:ectoine utilization protein EutC [Aureimonas fodinaquatilis]|uniref:Ectoine utilization protein EutC n=1 Tax=Aureimonas fodinaquatilis TaxID=2565783 RepID=A0A5B0DRC9_9HYPH|nr:ectoine utilization protein EutC [Aureimonas fodinaquatilis]KAA0968100.1 ectoine utilization protein EutC [Aureimonas fodinaquatilis]
MPEMLILTQRELADLVPLDLDAVNTVEAAFVALAEKPVVMPPILRLDIVENRGEVDVKTAYVPGIDSFAIKISPGFFNNPALGLPSVNGMMVLLSAQTGLVEALLLDNGYLTDIRTAAAGAVAARHMARADAKSVAVFGAGVQAQLQLQALMRVRPIEKATIWARDHAKALSTAALLAERLKIDVSAVEQPEAAAAMADIIVTTTPAEEPILNAEWVRAGTHITAMGSDAEHKNEIDPRLLAMSHYVADRLSQTRILGELHHAIAAGAMRSDHEFPELGAVAAGKSAGRLDAASITLADLTGTGVQDTAIATLAHARARRAGAGTVFAS